MRAVAAFLALALTARAVNADGRGQDPTIPHRIAVGAPAGIWPMYRGDATRSGRTRTQFPTTLVVERRTRLPADLASGPVVDARGHFVVATKDGKLLELSESGDAVFTLTLEAPAVLGPIIESGGTRVVVTRDAVAVGVSAAGNVVFTTSLTASPPTAARGSTLAEPLATRDGSAIVALGAQVTKLGPDGDLRATAEVDEPVAALTETARAVYLSTDTGRVLEWTPPREPRLIGTLGGKPSSEVVALDGDRLLGVARRGSVVELSVRDGARATLLSLAPDAVIDTPAITQNGELRLLTRTGWLLGFAGSRETLRHSVSVQSVLPVFAAGDAPPPLVDPSGATAFVTANATLGVVQSSGETHTSSITECGPPVALVPAGVRRLAVVCRSGTLAFVGEGRPSRDSTP